VGDVMKELLTVVGGAGIVVAGLAWLTRALLTHWMDKDLEGHKTALRAQSDIAIEQLRSELRQQSLEHEVKFRRTDEKIAEVLDQVYRRLVDFYDCLVKYLKIVEYSGEPSKEAKLEETSKASRGFWDVFIPNRLYIPPAVFEATKAFADKLVTITNDFTFHLKDVSDGAPVDSHFWSKAWKEINDEQGSVFSSLVKEFQRRLGVRDFD